MKSIIFTFIISLQLTSFIMAQMPMPTQAMAVPNNQVRAIAVDGDFTYIGGDFNYVGPHNGFGTQVDKNSGVPDYGFPIINGRVLCSLPDGNGGWYIGGSFYKVGDHDRLNFAHLYADGSVDNNWKPEANSDVSVMVRDGNYLYVGGSFWIINEKPRSKIARIHIADGTVDEEWSADANASVKTILIDEKNIYVGGYFQWIGGKQRNYIARTNKINGEVDTVWNPNANDNVTKILKHGNKLYVSGKFSNIGGAARWGLAKLNNIDGSAENDWICNASSYVTAVELDINNEKLYVGGLFPDSSGDWNELYVKRFHFATGEIDTTWNQSSFTFNDIRELKLDGNFVYIGGKFNKINGPGKRFIARLRKTDASLDESWKLEAEWDVQSIVFNEDKMFVGGWFKSIGGKFRHKVARINNIIGELDTLWNPNVETNMEYAYVYAIAVDENAVYFGGDFKYVNGVSCKNIAKVNKSNGKLDSLWQHNPNGNIYAITLKGGYIYLGGSFTSINGQQIAGLIKMNKTDGSTVSQWNPRPNSAVETIVFDGELIYVGGGFSAISGLSRKGLARLDDITGAVDTLFNPIPSSKVTSIAIDESDIYVGGYFYTIGGFSRNHLAKISKSTGLVNPQWNPNADGNVFTAVANGNDIYIGGNFSNVGGQERKYLAKLNKTNGDADPSWNPVGGNYVRKMVSSNDDIYVGGTFISFNGKWRPYLALFTNRILPVELTSFKGEIINNNVQLDWTTATENNSHRFVIEKNFNSEWRPIGYVNASGNSTTPRSYRFIDEISDASSLTYRLKIVDFDGSYEYSSTISLNINHAFEYSLDQNYPNPFNPSTTIKFALPNDTKVVLEVFNFLGERVATLLNQEMTSGYHQVDFEGSNLSSGVYIYRLSAGEFSSVKKFTLLK